MEVDHVPYIFGSFSRRRHSQEVNKTKRRSVDTVRQPPENLRKKDSIEIVQRTRSFSRPFLELFQKKEEILEEDTRRRSAIRLALEDESPIFGQIPTFPRSIRKESNSVRTKHNGITFEENVQYIPSVSTKIEDNCDEFTCLWCKKTFTEPRVLQCLHSFCTKCLIDIENEEYNNVFEGPIIDKRDGSIVSEILKENSSRRNSYAPRRKKITCPKCEKITHLSSDGVRCLPHNYILQHRLLLASLNKEPKKLLCDLCRDEKIATHRCSECLRNLCPTCLETHVKDPKTSQHEILGLRDRGITKIQRQIMCRHHPEKPLVVYCTNCYQVVCKDCAKSMHRNHVVEVPSRACSSKSVGVKDAMERTRSYTDRAETLNERLRGSQRTWLNQCATVEQEIEEFIEEYKKSIDEHKETLLQQVNQVKDEHLKTLVNHERSLDKKIQEAKYTIKFADDLLKEGNEIEILTFLDQILRKLQILTSTEEDLTPPKIMESVQFLPNESKDNLSGKFLLTGVISTQKVSPENCVILKEGSGLDNLRVHRKTEILLETRDATDNPLTHGGLNVTAELLYRDAGLNCRALSVNIHDRKDGTYLITFVPDTPGKLSLNVTVKGQPIRNSPFPITVRQIRPHSGVYHCCSFCSGSSGACGCGGKMPGKFTGCGHGHEGHPGRRHWSCCGNILENSECRRHSVQPGLYQFTL